jgi:mannose-6-phosphate isomerase-like protein (cupin superfamily)
MRKITIKDIPLGYSHNSIARKSILKKNDTLSKIESMNEAYLQPGEQVEAHSHEEAEEVFVFLTGVGEMKIDNQIVEIINGDVILVQPHEVHILTNTGNEPMKFFTFRVGL